MKNLIEYMPPFLRNVREYNRIFDAEDIEIADLNTNMNLLLTEVIVNEAVSFGLDRYESIYGITNVSDNIITRRAVILAKIQSRTPYTYKWLYNLLLSIFGEGNFEIIIDYNNYSIEIKLYGLYSEAADAIIEDIYYKIPANLERTFSLSTQGDYIIGATLVQKENTTLIIDTSVIEETEEISCSTNIGTHTSQIENTTMYVNTSTIEEEEDISQVEYIGGTMVQKENQTLYANTETITQEENVSNDQYIGLTLIQKENINLNLNEEED